LVSSPNDASRPLVLIVEDNAQAAELLVRHLNRGGFRTEVASDGAEALSKARELTPAAITLDVLLPKLDGWTVLTHLGRDEATKGIPVLVVSVVDDPDLGLALGAIDYMVKPVDGKELLERIRRLQFRTDVVDRGVRLLVVDDEEANRYWLKTVLEPAGYDVIAARDGREALELVASKKPDLVLLDLVMPEMSGFDVVDAMTAQDADGMVPIVIITSKDLTEAEKQMLNGRVAATLGRASIGASDLLMLLDQITQQPAVP
jgi:DNA-binding response OmpR family regulator